MGCLWGCTDYSLGMFAARGSNSWIYDTSHLRYVRYVWSCIFLLFNKSAWAANTWIGGHFWAFTSGMSNYYAKYLFTILLICNGRNYLMLDIKSVPVNLTHHQYSFGSGGMYWYSLPYCFGIRRASNLLCSAWSMVASQMDK